MSDLGKFGASAAEFFSNPMLYNDKVTSTRRIDIAEVASSLPAAPTIERSPAFFWIKGVESLRGSP